jgi:hypothetical protein
MGSHAKRRFATKDLRPLVNWCLARSIVPKVLPRTASLSTQADVRCLDVARLDKCRLARADVLRHGPQRYADAARKTNGTERRKH